jgi:hypothetical protein
LPQQNATLLSMGIVPPVYQNVVGFHLNIEVKLIFPRRGRS